MKLIIYLCFIMAASISIIAAQVTTQDCFDFSKRTKKLTVEEIVKFALEILSKGKSYQRKAREMLDEADSKKEMAKSAVCAAALLDNNTGKFHLDISNEEDHRIYLIGHNLDPCNWTRLELRNGFPFVIWFDYWSNLCYSVKVKPDKTYYDNNVYIHNKTLYGEIVNSGSGSGTSRYLIASGRVVNKTVCDAEPSAFEMGMRLGDHYDIFSAASYDTTQVAEGQKTKAVYKWSKCRSFNKLKNAWYTD